MERMKISTLIFFSIFCCVSSNNTCLETDKSCEIWLTIEERLSMTWHKERVYAKNGRLFKVNSPEHENDTKIPLEEVITLDGYERAVISVNGTIPGPAITAYDGQLLVVHVANHLLSESITVHWHGLHQRGTPFMDGVAFITQCPISPGQKFTYRFKASPKGTFWYHSHIGGQRVDGLYGALIIKERTTNENEDKIMHVGDWFHSSGSQLHTKMIWGNFKSQPGFQQQRTLDGVYYAPTIFKSALIEGRGRYYDNKTGKWSETPFKTYEVEAGKTYRFRVICPGVIYPFRVSVDNHTISVVSMDGYDIKPRVFESFIINPGERFDFLLTADQIIEAYWIRAQALEVGFPDHEALAILHYATALKHPSSRRRDCSDSKCDVLNCPYPFSPPDLNCVPVDKMEGRERAPEFDKEELFMNFAQDRRMMNINGKHFEHPGVSSLTQSDDVDMELDCHNCPQDDICYCHHEVEVPLNKTIQMVWSNHGYGSTRHHPIHLHGHSFYVLKIAFGEYNTTNGLKLSNNPDINCTNEEAYCIQPQWSNTAWRGGKVPGLNERNPPRKDTLMIPAGAYAVIRIRADNPGKWFLHCHIEFHSMQGMAMIVNEGKGSHPPPPPGFPICQNFHYDSSIDQHYVKKKETPAEKTKNDFSTVSIAIIVVLSVLVFVLIFTLIYLNSRQKRIVNNNNTNAVITNTTKL